MKTRDVAKRLKAFADGRPLEAGSTITTPIAEPEDRMALSFVRMGGESLPWGIGYQIGDEEPVLLSVPDGRQRDPVGDMCVQLAQVLCGFLGSPILTGEVVDPKNPPPIPLRQVWLPNQTHIEMLHLLNLRYSRITYGEPARSMALRALGRASGFLFRESERAGQMTVIDASSALRDHFVFPVDDLRQQHLGFLLAMLGTGGALSDRMEAAEEAEKLSVSHTLGPDLERDELQPLVGAFSAARKDDDDAAEAEAASGVRGIIDGENARRLGLVSQAVDLLAGDPRPVNGGVAQLVAGSIKERDFHYRWSENKGSQDGDVALEMTTSAVTDGTPTSASKRYYRLLAAADLSAVCLLHDDEELQRVAVAEGDGVDGVLMEVAREPSRRSGKETEVWKVTTDASSPTRVREGTKLCVAGSPGRDCLVTEVSVSAETRVITLEPDRKLHGALDEDSAVLFLPTTAPGIGIRKSTKAGEQDGPGAWLTHGASGRPRKRRLKSDDVLERVKGLRGG